CEASLTARRRPGANLSSRSIILHQSPLGNLSAMVLCMSHTDARPYVWMLCGSFSFTLMAELAHVLTRQCDWQTVAVFRAGLVALFAVVLARVMGAKLVFWPWRLWVRSVAGRPSLRWAVVAVGGAPAAR